MESNLNKENNSITHIEKNEYIINYNGCKFVAKKLSDSVYSYDEQMKTGSGFIGLMSRYLKQNQDKTFDEISCEKAMQLIELENNVEKTL